MHFFHLNSETYIHLCLPFFLRQDSVQSGGGSPAQGVRVHLILARVSPQPLHVPLNQPLSSDQHSPITQRSRAHELRVRVEREARRGDVQLNTSTKTSSSGPQVLHVLGGT